jgi:hypothetical protein
MYMYIYIMNTNIMDIYIHINNASMVGHLYQSLVSLLVSTNWLGLTLTP